MPAVKLEPGAPVVIEAPQFPITRVMAGTALRAEPTLVRVLPMMAGHASGRGVLKGLRAVTCLASKVLVLAQDWETSQVMVKLRFLPG